MDDQDMLHVTKRVRTDQRYCPHCSRVLCYKTFKSHKRLYYNSETNDWYQLPGDVEVENMKEKASPPPDLECDTDGEEPHSPLQLDEDQPSLTSEESPPLSDAASLSDSDSSCQFEEEEQEIWSDTDIEDLQDKNHHQSNIQPESPPRSQHETPLSPIRASSKTFFLVLGRLYGPCNVISTDFPTTLYMAKKSYKGLQNVRFQKLPVCKRCGTVWKLSDCIESQGTTEKAKLCSKVLFGSSRQECKSKLLKTVELASKRTIFYPLMMYCYVDLGTSLQSLLFDPNFSTECELWKSRNVFDNCLRDVYDGRIWKEFMEYNGHSFLSDNCSYGLMINMDWFQPYKHLTYSVGAIYLSVFNLPRQSRYKLQNICLIGIIPGPHEPELTVNQYINPLVQDLAKFWSGQELEVYCGSTVERKIVRCAILCCSCDLPAGRKLCGFLAHSAHLGCSKCMKYFPSTSTGYGLDFSGFQRQNWTSRTNQTHRQAVARLSHCKNKTELRKKESELGCRYSALLDLPYFDAPRMLVIDPMHCLFLGLAKHFVKRVFIGKGVLSETDFAIIQQRVSALSVPPDIGRIPHKIELNFYSFTADQYKNWVIHYSIICLHGLLSSEHLECWRHLVLACRYLCQSTLKPEDVIIADRLLLKFCTRTETLFGKDIITPNMHMSCHISECILDYGPLNHFWLFAFERFNGILGKLPNNNRSIEAQMMKRFLSDNEVMRIPIPTEFKEDFENLVTFQKKPVGTVENDSTESPGLEVPHSSTRSVFNSSELDELNRVFNTLYPGRSFNICSCFTKYSTITIGGKAYGTIKSRSKHTNIVLAELQQEIRPARINYFAKVSSMCDGIVHSHVFACLSWYKHHAQKDACGKPVTIWEHNLFDLCSFLPVEKIKSRTISLVDKLSPVYGNVLFISPYQ